jgi:hypothetical protein
MERFVIYSLETGRIVCGNRTFAYKKVAERHAGKIEEAHQIECGIMTQQKYDSVFGGMTRKVVNLMSGKEVEININTPLSCDPSSETYWSM